MDFFADFIPYIVFLSDVLNFLAMIYNMCPTFLINLYLFFLRLCIKMGLKWFIVPQSGWFWI